MIDLRFGNCLNLLRDIPDNVVFVSDPPFNIGYKYNTYKDRMDEDSYYKWLSEIFGGGQDRALLSIIPRAFTDLLRRLIGSRQELFRGYTTRTQDGNTEISHFLELNPICQRLHSLTRTQQTRESKN